MPDKMKEATHPHNRENRSHLRQHSTTTSAKSTSRLSGSRISINGQLMMGSHLIREKEQKPPQIVQVTRNQAQWKCSLTSQWTHIRPRCSFLHISQQITLSPWCLQRDGAFHKLFEEFTFCNRVQRRKASVPKILQVRPRGEAIYSPPRYPPNNRFFSEPYTWALFRARQILPKRVYSKGKSFKIKSNHLLSIKATKV